jgi:hypothetical protein
MGTEKFLSYFNNNVQKLVVECALSIVDLQDMCVTPA